MIIPERLSRWARAEGVRALALPETLRERSAVGGWIRRAVSSFAPDLLLVDVFPRGVLGELGEDLFLPPRRAWLVSRRVRPDYYLAPGVREAIETRYEGILWCEKPPEELGVLRVHQERVPPILIRAPGECLGREEARRRLGVPRAARLILALGSGEGHRERAERALLEKVRARLAASGTPALARYFSPLDRGSPFPAMTFLRAADAVVAAGGYHSFHEARCLGIPAVFLPRPRLYDDQFLRAAGERIARSPAELEAGLHAILSSAPGARRPREDCGATAAWALLRRSLSSICTRCRSS